MIGYRQCEFDGWRGFFDAEDWRKSRRYCSDWVQNARVQQTTTGSVTEPGSALVMN
jgi:hypothetical protein